MKMAGQENKVIKSGIWYIISNILIRAVGIITSPIYTRILTPAEKGVADAFNSYISIFTTVTCLCLIYSVGRAKLDFKDRFDGYMSSIQTLSSGFGLLILAGVCMNMKYVQRLLPYQKAEIFLMFLYLILYPSLDYMQYKYRFEYKYKENILISVIICISTVVFSVGLIFAMPDDKAFAKILGTVLPGLIVGVWCYITLLCRGKVLYNREYWIYALKIGLPMIPHGLALVLLNKIDSIMIQKMCGETELGIYTTGYSFAVLLSVITNAIGQAWLPWFNEKLYGGEKEAVKEKNLLLMQLGCFLTLGFVAVGPEVIKLLCSRNFWDAMWIIPPVAVGTLCQYFYTNYVNVELFYKKTFIIALNSIAAAVINVFLNWLFIGKYGYLAAAYTTVAGYFILMILHYIAVRWILKEKIYRDGVYFVLLLCTGTAGCLFLFTYQTILLRYAVITALAIAALFFRKDELLMLYASVRKRRGKE